MPTELQKTSQNRTCKQSVIRTRPMSASKQPLQPRHDQKLAGILHGLIELRHNTGTKTQQLTLSMLTR